MIKDILNNIHIINTRKQNIVYLLDLFEDKEFDYESIDVIKKCEKNQEIHNIYNNSIFWNKRCTIDFKSNDTIVRKCQNSLINKTDVIKAYKEYILNELDNVTEIEKEYSTIKFTIHRHVNNIIGLELKELEFINSKNIGGRDHLNTTVVLNNINIDIIIKEIYKLNN